MTDQPRLDPAQLSDPAAATALNATGFNDALGLVFTEVTPDRVHAHWTVTDRHHQPFGIVHGGVYCAVVETVASVGGSAWFGDRGVCVGVNNNTDFLRATREGVLTAIGTPVHRGRTQQLWKVTITDEQDRLVSQGQVRLANVTDTGHLGG